MLPIRQRRAAAKLGEDGLHLALAKAEAAQGGEDFRVRVDVSRRHRFTVERAIGVPEGEGPVAATLEQQLAAMDRSMMRRAEARILAASLRPHSELGRM